MDENDSGRTECSTFCGTLPPSLQFLVHFLFFGTSTLKF